MKATKRVSSVYERTFGRSPTCVPINSSPPVGDFVWDVHTEGGVLIGTYTTEALATRHVESKKRA